jgi:hypothetical protein
MTQEVQDNAKDPLLRNVGKFMFTMIATRLDLAMVVGAMNQFMHNPQMDHGKLLRRFYVTYKEPKTIGSNTRPWMT